MRRSTSRRDGKVVFAAGSLVDGLTSGASATRISADARLSRRRPRVSTSTTRRTCAFSARAADRPRRRSSRTAGISEGPDPGSPRLAADQGRAAARLAGHDRRLVRRPPLERHRRRRDRRAARSRGLDEPRQPRRSCEHARTHELHGSRRRPSIRSRRTRSSTGRATASSGSRREPERRAAPARREPCRRARVAVRLARHQRRPGRRVHDHAREQQPRVPRPGRQRASRTSAAARAAARAWTSTSRSISSQHSQAYREAVITNLFYGCNIDPRRPLPLRLRRGAGQLPGQQLRPRRPRRRLRPLRGGRTEAARTTPTSRRRRSRRPAPACRGCRCSCGPATSSGARTRSSSPEPATSAPAGRGSGRRPRTPASADRSSSSTTGQRFRPRAATPLRRRSRPARSPLVDRAYAATFHAEDAERSGRRRERASSGRQHDQHATRRSWPAPSSPRRPTIPTVSVTAGRRGGDQGGAARDGHRPQAPGAPRDPGRRLRHRDHLPRVRARRLEPPDRRSRASTA